HGIGQYLLVVRQRVLPAPFVRVDHDPDLPRDFDQVRVGVGHYVVGVVRNLVESVEDRRIAYRKEAVRSAVVQGMCPIAAADADRDVAATLKGVDENRYVGGIVEPPRIRIGGRREAFGTQLGDDAARHQVCGRLAVGDVKAPD